MVKENLNDSPEIGNDLPGGEQSQESETGHQPGKVNVTEMVADVEIEPFELETGAVSATIISDPGNPAFKDPDVVMFKVAYAKDFEGEKHMKEGSTYPVHKETAKLLVEKKIGKIVK
jgi:hypothetical protein